MRKNCFLILCLALALLGLTACGSSSPAPAATAAPAAPAAAPQPTEAPTPEPAAAPAVSIDGSTITLRDDGTGESVQDAGMSKRVILTARGIDYTVTTGPVVLTVESAQVAELIARDQDTALYLDIPQGQPVTLVGIQISAENTADEDAFFHPGISTILTSDQEQVESDLILSDDVGGLFMGQARKTGQVFFLCKNTDPDALSHITWRIDPARLESEMPGGDPVRIEFELAK